MEFRCFVKQKQLIAISQRDYTNYYSCLEEQKEDIIDKIESFFQENVQSHFPNDNYVLDLYLSKNCVVIIDFNPFSPTTDPLLFSWPELSRDTAELQLEELHDTPVGTHQKNGIQFRFIASALPVRSSEFSGNRLPRDAVDVSTHDAILEFANSSLFKI